MVTCITFMQGGCHWAPVKSENSENTESVTFYYKAVFTSYLSCMYFLEYLNESHKPDLLSLLTVTLNLIIKKYVLFCAWSRVLFMLCLSKG